MNTLKSIKSLTSIALVLFAFTSLGFSQEKKKLEYSEPKVIGALFYADWCSSCKTLAPKLKAAKAKFVNKPALLTTFDMTNLTSQYQSGQLAKALGLSKIFTKTGVKTGFMLLIDPETGKQIGKINPKDSVDEIVSKIEKVL